MKVQSITIKWNDFLNRINCKFANYYYRKLIAIIQNDLDSIQ